MLTSLSIKNFALIEHLEMDFSEKLSIITGETGAGKSILLGALGLVLGKRADLTSLKNKEEKCVIEAHFNIADYQLQNFFSENDLDYEPVSILRREILPSGKSRAFINDSPVNLNELTELGEFLIDIHSQHETRELTQEAYQVEILDAFCGNQEYLSDYKNKLVTYKKSQSELRQLLSDKEQIAKEHDYNSFLLNELLAANLKIGEQEEFEATQEKLSNVEAIAESFEKSLTIANDEQIGVIHNLKEIKAALQKIAGLSSEYQTIYDRITSVLIELDDVMTELHNESGKLINDPEQLDLVNQKLQTLYSLQKKHNVGSVEELITIQTTLDDKVILADDLENTIAKLEEAITSQQLELDKLADKISEKRKASASELTNKISEILTQLGMPNARFQFEIKESTTILATGKDEIQLLFSANKGTDFGLLKKVASGGEMSRIMLAVKSIMAEYTKLPTIIFDEIDTGVSGEVAHKMGDIMKKMANGMQVFAITHLPQIAAKGQQHYKVFKSVVGETTISELKMLSTEERVVEIAEMLSGKDITDSALNHAKALLN
ncbi:DNA repair protein RecN [Flavobacterium sp.]|uniref:DNA repair protein RecN n=1 Tax=Flavobacterium sp. TaxID=239 RepID=UPI0028BF1B7C|nr:DNA repair protein RecN [Flavobacterium sp.]